MPGYIPNRSRESSSGNLHSNTKFSGRLLFQGFASSQFFAAFWGNRDLQAFWTAQREWAALLQAVALVSVAVIFVRLGMIAARRYGQDVAEEGMPPVPAWFRLVLAAMELGQMAGLMGIVLVRVLDLDGQWSDAVLVCLLGAIALTIGQALLRWRAETYGWVTGRLFWGRFG